jgi:hypothetical protein
MDDFISYGNIQCSSTRQSKKPSLVVAAQMGEIYGDVSFPFLYLFPPMVLQIRLLDRFTLMTALTTRFGLSFLEPNRVVRARFGAKTPFGGGAFDKPPIWGQKSPKILIFARNVQFSAIVNISNICLTVRNRRKI